MASANLIEEERRCEGRVALISFDSQRASNSLTLEAMQALHDRALALQRDRNLVSVVLCGRPERFSLGFDLADAAALQSMPLAERRETLSIGPRMCRAWSEIEALTIAAVEGWCVGGGVALACSLDLRVAGEGTTIYVPEIERGLSMSWGSLPRLVNLVGPAKTKRLVVLAERLSAAQAQSWGLVDHVVEDGGVRKAAEALALQAAAKPPVALRMCKQAIDAYANALAPVASALDRDQFLLALASDDGGEGIASFLEKRPPRWTGS